MVTDSYLIERIGMVTEEGNEWGKMGVKWGYRSLGGGKLLKTKDVLTKIVGENGVGNVISSLAPNQNSEVEKHGSGW